MAPTLHRTFFIKAILSTKRFRQMPFSYYLDERWLSTEKCKFHIEEGLKLRKFISGAIPFMASGFVLVLMYYFGVEVLVYLYALAVLSGRKHRRKEI